jgi:prepilin signal peptidase PulO-like enzyme (type II secretory pathway)
LPRRCLSVFRPARSFCPRCKYQIKWHENIPILGWLRLGGKCANCTGAIHWRYPFVELVMLVLFGWIAWRDLAGGRFTTVEAWGLFVVHASFASALLTCSLIDWEFQIIPDEIDVPGLLLAPVAVALFPALLVARPWRSLPPLAEVAGWLHLQLGSAFAWWGLDALTDPLLALWRLPSTHPDLYPHLAGLAGGLFGAAAGAGFVFLLGWAFTRLLGRDAMGFGDVKYMAMIGGLTGWQGVVTTLVIGCLAGSLGGLTHMAWSGRSQLTGADVRDDLTPLASLALRLTGAKPAPAQAPVEIRPGTSFLARFATGDPYVPFGPFLSLGAFIAAFWPGAIQALLIR